MIDFNLLLLLLLFYYYYYYLINLTLGAGPGTAPHGENGASSSRQRTEKT